MGDPLSPLPVPVIPVSEARRMESSRAVPAPGAHALTRVLCLLILLLMAIAATYGGSIALRYLGQIGV
jgi:hypothetical protein